MTDLNSEVRELNIDELDAVSGRKGAKGPELLGALVDAAGNIAAAFGAEKLAGEIYWAASNIDPNAGATHVT